MKSCRSCSERKPLSCFYKAAINADGYKNQCIDCKRAEAAAYRQRNADTIKKQKRAWAIANPDMVAAQNRRARREGGPLSKERIREYSRDYYSRNRDRYARRDVERRAAVLQATPRWADEDAIRAVYIEAGRLIDSGRSVHVDHIVPLRGKNVCGLHVHWNLRIVPANENLRKGAKFDEGLANSVGLVHSAALTAEQ